MCRGGAGASALCCLVLALLVDALGLAFGHRRAGSPEPRDGGPWPSAADTRACEAPACTSTLVPRTRQDPKHQMTLSSLVDLLITFNNLV